VTNADPHQPAVYERNSIPQRGDRRAFGTFLQFVDNRRQTSGEVKRRKTMRHLETSTRRLRPARYLAALLAVLALLGLAAVGGKLSGGGADTNRVSWTG
jgi:hypothetical protein